MTYTAFTLDEIKAALPDIDAGQPDGNYWAQVSLPRTREIVLELVCSALWSVRCYTGCEPSAASRDKGTDAIRLVLIDVETDRPAAKAKRVHRTGDLASLRARLLDRFEWLKAQAQSIPRCTCGAARTARRVNKQTGVEFWGCPVWKERHTK